MLVLEAADAMVRLRREPEERKLEMLGQLLERDCHQVGNEEIRMMSVGNKIRHGMWITSVRTNDNFCLFDRAFRRSFCLFDRAILSL